MNECFTLTEKNKVLDVTTPDLTGSDHPNVCWTVSMLFLLSLILFRFHGVKSFSFLSSGNYLLKARNTICNCNSSFYLNKYTTFLSKEINVKVPSTIQGTDA